MRLLLACALAKVVNPNVDIRKPYTELGGTDSFSGRTYDERYITALINEHKLPANSTTAFLSPALRTKNPVLVRGINLAIEECSFAISPTKNSGVPFSAQ